VKDGAGNPMKYYGLAAKLLTPQSSWNGVSCGTSGANLPNATINPGDTKTYDMYFELGTYPVYKVYAKITDTIEGNTSGGLGLWKQGVISSNSGEIPVMPKPFIYSLEIDAERKDNPQERAQFSILYEY
jgi:hypothetical protein